MLDLKIQTRVEISSKISRMSWSSRKDFLYSLVALTVGLGNAWRFPILLRLMGGGAFLIPYTLVTVFLAIPITYMELSLGQFSERGQIGIWMLCPLAKGVGWGLFTYNIMLCTYQNILISYCMYYFFSSFALELPWSKCNADWALENCITREENATIYENCILKNGKEYCDRLHWELAPEHFWRHKVLNVLPDNAEGNLGNIKWDLSLCLLLSCLIVALALSLGLHSIEKIWQLATEQVFYSMGIASGSLIIYGSYCPFRSPVHADAITVNLVDYGTSLIFGIVLYNCLGAISYDLNIDLDNVARGKPLTFVLIPEALLHLHGPKILWSLVFYSTVVCVGISAVFSLMIANLSIIYDMFPATRRYKMYMAGLAGLMLFLFGLPFTTRGGSTMVNMVDNFSGGPILVFVSLLEVMAVSWLYGVKRLTDDVHFMLGFRPTTFWQACWLLAPAYLIFIFVMGLYEPERFKYSSMLLALGWSIFSIIVIAALGIGLYYAIHFKMLQQGLQVLKPDMLWGPKDPTLMKSRRMFSSQAMTKEYMYRQTRLQARNRICQRAKLETKL